MFRILYYVIPFVLALVLLGAMRAGAAGTPCARP